jgi:hypothetical protein
VRTGRGPLSYDDILKRLDVLAAKKRKMKKILPGRREEATILLDILKRLSG